MLRSSFSVTSRLVRGFNELEDYLSQQAEQEANRSYHHEDESNIGSASRAFRKSSPVM
jgi:phage regulator Rha-like protein